MARGIGKTISEKCYEHLTHTAGSMHGKEDAKHDSDKCRK